MPTNLFEFPVLKINQNNSLTLNISNLKDYFKSHSKTNIQHESSECFCNKKNNKQQESRKSLPSILKPERLCGTCPPAKTCSCIPSVNTCNYTELELCDCSNGKRHVGVLFKPKVGTVLTMTLADMTKDVCLQLSDINLESETQTLTTCECKKCKGVDGKVDCGCPLVFSCDSGTKVGPECNCDPKQNDESTKNQSKGDTKSTTT